MTENRFEIDDSDIVIVDVVTGKSYIFDSYGDCSACFDLLNELHKENEQLKQSIDWMGGRLQGLWANYN